MKSIAQQLVEKGMIEGIELGKQEGKEEGRREARQEGQIKFATYLIKTTNQSDAEIAEATELVIEQVSALRTKLQG